MSPSSFTLLRFGSPVTLEFPGLFRFVPFASGVLYLSFVLPFALLERRGAFAFLLNRLRRTDSFFTSQIFYKSLYDLKDFVYRLQRIAGFL